MVAMAIPNLIGLILLSNVVVRLAGEFSKIKKEEILYKKEKSKLE